MRSFLIFLACLALGHFEEPPLLAPGREVEAAVEAGDPAIETARLGRIDPPGHPTRGKAYRVTVQENGLYHLEMRSPNFQGYLVLRDEKGSVLAEDDFGLWGILPRLTARLEAGREYRVEAGARYGDPGPFRLVLRKGAPERIPAREEISRAAAFAREGLEGLEGLEEATPPRPESAALGTTLHRLAFVLSISGDPAEALETARRAVKVRERVLGDHAATAESLGLLGQILLEGGNVSEAVPLFERELRIVEKFAGPGHPLTADPLNFLGGCRFEQGDYAGAARLLERAVEVSQEGDLEARIGYLDNLCHALEAQGDDGAARPRLERLREELARAGPSVPPLLAAQVDHRLALTLYRLGDFAAALPLARKALDMEGRVRGEDALESARDRKDLGAILFELGRFAEARVALERALEGAEKRLGPRDPRLVAFLVNLAALLHTERNFAEAEPRYRRALEIQEGAAGEWDPGLATILHDLARMQWDRGDLESSLPLFERVLSIRKKTLGEEDPLTAQTLDNLGRLRRDRGEMDQAYALARRAFESGQEQLAGILWSLTESERLEYAAQMVSSLELLLSLEPPRGGHAGGGAGRPARQGYEALLRWKGGVARSLLASRRRILQGLARADRARLVRLREVQARISRALYAPAAPGEDPGARGDELARLRRERAALELELARAAGQGPAQDPIGVDRVLASLPEGSALVDFVIRRRYVPREAGPQGKDARPGHWSAPLVSAWVVGPDHTGPRPLDLDPASEMEPDVRRFLQALVSRRGADLVDEDPAAELRRRLWDPLAPLVRGAKRIFVSPDTFLGSLPLEVLSLEDGSYVVEHYGFVYLQDMTALVRLAGEEPRPGESGRGGLLVVGDVDYNRAGGGETPSRAVPELVASLGAGSGARGGEETTLPAAEHFWERLPFTRGEALSIAEMYQTSFGEGGGAPRLLLLRGDATEGRIKEEMPRHAVVHITTHGFYQPEGIVSAWERAIAQRERRGGADDDGFLTAEEFSWLDLSGVDLLVLSACQSGLGSPRGGEGMIGLRRAARQAGARAVVTSLWRVPDDLTSELMKGFYQRRWFGGEGKLEAIQHARLALLRRNRMENDGRGLPWSWGAFVLSGDWR